MNNCAHLARRNYTQRKLHFQYCVVYIFVKWLPRNFYSVSKKLKNYISLQFHIDPFTKHREKKIGKLTIETTLVYAGTDKATSEKVF